MRRVNQINPGVEGSNPGRVNQNKPGVQGSNPRRLNQINPGVEGSNPEYDCKCLKIVPKVSQDPMADCVVSGSDLLGLPSYPAQYSPVLAISLLFRKLLP